MEPEIFIVHTHKKTSKQIPKKINTNTDGTPIIKTVKQRTKKVAEIDAEGNEIELKQKFSISHGEKSCIVKMGNISFGIKMGELGIESIMRNCDKDIESIRSILNVMKTMKKANISFSAISTRLTLAAENYMPQTIKQFQGALSKPPAAKPVQIENTVAEINHHSDDNFATPEHLHI